MSSSLVRRAILLCAILAIPAAAFAQEAVLTGTVTDSTGAVLPGVTVRAVHEASGNSFEAVTDGRGIYRMSVRTGTYQINAQLTGFSPVTRRGVELLVGQNAVINLQMVPGSRGSGDGHRGIAAGQYGDVESGRQRRSAPGAGVAGGAAQLDGPRAAGSRQPHHVDELDCATDGPARRRHARVSAERRRPAGVVGIGRRQSAAVQPGLDFGVPVHRQPVRRNRRPLDGRTGERHHEVGHQQVLGAVPHQFPEQQLQRARIRSPSGCSRSAINNTAWRSAVRFSRTSCITSATSRTSSIR